MPSPKTDPGQAARRWERFNPRSTAALLQRLNVRLVFILSLVALVGLVVSGVAITQILPGYFAQQTQENLQTAARSSAILVRSEVERVADGPGADILVTRETRDQVIVARLGPILANIFRATITIVNDLGQEVVLASPTVPEIDLRRDTEVAPESSRVEVPLPGGLTTFYTVVVSEPYSAREETMEQIRGALLGSGALALLSSLVAGVIAARGLTQPISRLRRMAGRVATGNLDERAVPSGVLEIDELAQQFNVMADRLQGTLSMLEADRDRLREFVADVSHELRTPIAALRMYTELQGNADVDDASRREFLERSMEQIGRLEWLSTNLLDLSRIDAGIFPLDMRTGDLRDPVQAAVQALSEEAMARGVALESAVPNVPVELRFDRERIVQLMTNLIGNALKFTPRGGGVSVGMADGADEAVITVGDTGPGIPADELPRIFERFYRGTNTGDARASGSGLGLAIVRSIVDMHDGRIDVGSEIGRGTEFRVHLPRTGTAAEEPAAAVAKVNETSRAQSPARNRGAVG